MTLKPGLGGHLKSLKMTPFDYDFILTFFCSNVGTSLYRWWVTTGHSFKFAI